MCHRKTRLLTAAAHVSSVQSNFRVFAFADRLRRLFSCSLRFSHPFALHLIPISSLSSSSVIGVSALSLIQ
jgi:hypothetical protein